MKLFVFSVPFGIIGGYLGEKIATKKGSKKFGDNLIP
jgi:hypothetical protein